MIKKTLLISGILSNILFANTIIPTTGSDLKITIYNDNLSFINDKRSTNIKKGFQKLIYEGVPSRLIPESVIPTFTGVKTNLYSQNYMYDLISLNSMLKNSINKNVQYYRNNYLIKDTQNLYEGILLSTSPVMIKDKSTGKILTLNNPNQIIFNSIPSSMITKPSLVWNIKSDNIGKLNINLKYLTTGISWKSDYVLNLNNKDLDLNGWITIKNNSGVNYKNAQITCLAGKVNIAQKNISLGRMIKYKSDMMAINTVNEVHEESFSGYHIYKIPFKENIQNKQNKQISFINKKNIKYSQYGINLNNNFGNYGKQKMIFKNIIEFKNEKNNNLGIPLPVGTVRMYKKDSKGETHFIGEDRIDNIPNKEKVKLKIGTMFDVVGTKKITKYKVDRYVRDIETSYEIRNRGEESVIVKIHERIPTYGGKITIDTNCKGQCSYVKETAFNRIFTIKLDAGEIYKFKSHFEVLTH